MLVWGASARLRGSRLPLFQILDDLIELVEVFSLLPCEQLRLHQIVNEFNRLLHISKLILLFCAAVKSLFGFTFFGYLRYYCVFSTTGFFRRVRCLITPLNLHFDAHLIVVKMLIIFKSASDLGRCDGLVILADDEDIISSLLLILNLIHHKAVAILGGSISDKSRIRYNCTILIILTGGRVIVKDALWS